MNKFTYDYKCYKLGEFIYGSLNLNSNKENEDVKKEAQQYLNMNLSNRFCFIKLENKTKTDETEQNPSHIVHFRLPVSYSAK